MLFCLLSGAQTVEADTGQSIPPGSREGSRVMKTAVRLHPVQVCSAQDMGRIREVLLHKGRIQADRLKQLCALISLQRGNAHLGSDFQDARRQRPVIILHRRSRILGHISFRTEFPDTVMRQIGIHRPGAESNQ